MTADKVLVAVEISARVRARACCRGEATDICWHHNLGMGLSHE